MAAHRLGDDPLRVLGVGNVAVSGRLVPVIRPYPESSTADGFVAKLDAGGELLPGFHRTIY